MNDLIDRIWHLLEHGANPGRERSPFTMLQAATLGPDGAPKVRTVVLRGVDRARRTLMFHSDARAAKVAELARDGRIALVGCDLANGLQIRLEGTATPRASEAERLAIWQASRPRTLILYRAPLPPGTPIAAPADAHPPASPEAHDEPAVDPLDGFAHFAVIDVRVDAIDWLDLAGDGHRRARFAHDAQAPAPDAPHGWRGGWVAP